MNEVSKFPWLDKMKPKDFFIILDVRRAKQTQFEQEMGLNKRFLISVGTSKKNFEECGLDTDIQHVKTFQVETFKDQQLIDHINNIINSHPYDNIIIVGDKHFDIKGCPRFGFKGEFHHKKPTAEKLALELEHYYLK
jgi:hypothetical protein